ncbi:MAG TPA: hypothetical protein PKI03_34120 [Pseudomonadota bacterium]|nr:hypothetical protein [Pseudomonadota bacterium]
MAAPGFRANVELYEPLLLAGIRVPGEWSCSEIERALDIKNPKSDGKDDGPLRVSGLLPTQGTITIKLDTDEEEREWERLAARIFPLDRPSGRNAVSVDHPIWKRLGIRSILVTGIKNAIPTGGDEQVCGIAWRSAKQPSGKAGTRKPNAASKEAIELRPNALTDTPAQQAQAAGGR